MKKKTKQVRREPPEDYVPQAVTIRASSGVSSRKAAKPVVTGEASTSTPFKNKLKETAPFLDLCVNLLSDIEALKARVAALEKERAITRTLRRRR